ncbi:MAG: PGPGW domain-containing protein [Candidatus Peribacteraceae bacterium]|nr:PGPGW domain-containing protein [Candidatus Peribacteraceae bacterium]
MSVLKKIVGVLLLLYGVIALVTPLTPAAAVSVFVGLELLGLSFLIPEKVRSSPARMKEWMRGRKREKKEKMEKK